MEFILPDGQIVDIGKIEVKLTEEEAEAIIKQYDHHIRNVLPELSAMLGVDINDVEGYQEYMKENQQEGN